MYQELYKDIIEKLPCGNCSTPLNVNENGGIINTIIIDKLSETPEKVKNGNVNYFRCSHCDFGAWIWPGTLIHFRSIDRTFFITMPSHEQTLANDLTEAIEQISKFSIKINISKVYILFDYKRVSTLLGYNDALYDLYLKTNAAFLKRQHIKNIEERARQFIKDSIRIGLADLDYEETQKSFYAVCLKIFKTEKTDAGEPLCETTMGKILIPLMEDRLPLLNESDPNAFKNLSFESGNFSSKLQNKISDVYVLNKELKRYVTEQADYFEHIICHTTNKKLRILAKTPLSAIRRKTISEFNKTIEQRKILNVDKQRLDVLEPTINSLNFSHNHKEFSYADKKLSIHDLINFAGSGYGNFQFTLAKLALEKSNLGDTEFYNGVLEFLIEIFNKFGDCEAGYLCHVLVHTELEQTLLEDEVIALLCHGLFIFFEAIGTDQSIIEFAAISLNTVAKVLVKRNFNEMALLFSGKSTELFKSANRIDGIIESEILCLQLLSRINFHESTLNKAKHTLLMIESELKKEYLPIWQLTSIKKNHIIVLAILAKLSFILSKDKLESISLISEFDGELAEEDLTATCQNYEEFLIDKEIQKQQGSQNDKIDKCEYLIRDNEISREELTNQLSSIASSKFNGSQNNAHDTNKSLTTQLLLTTYIAVKNQPNYVLSASFFHVSWATYYVKAIVQAKLYHDYDLWIQLYTLFITTLQDKGLDSVARFVLKLMQKNISELPEKVEITIPFLIELIDISTHCNLYIQQGTTIFLESEIPNKVLKLFSTYIEYRNDSKWRTKKWLTEADEILLAEILELTGQYEQSALLNLQLSCKYLSIPDKEVSSTPLTLGYSSSIYNISTGYTTGIYRAIRSLAKPFAIGRGDTSDLITNIINLTEVYKIAKNMHIKNLSMDNVKQQEPYEHIISTIEIPFKDLAEYYPADNLILSYTLLPNSNSNFGFWLVYLLVPASRELLWFKVLTHEQIYSSYQKVADAFIKEEKRLYLDDKNKNSNDELNTSLAELSQALLPSDFGELVAANSTRSIAILPDAYLYDVPWNALSTNYNDKKTYIHKIGDENIALSIQPTWSLPKTCKDKKRANNSNLTRNIKCICSPKPEWRQELHPIYGARKIVSNLKDSLFTEKNVQLNTGNTKQDFVDMLYTSKFGLYYGHGEKKQSNGTVLLADDASIDFSDIQSLSNGIGLNCEFLMLCSCYGIDGNLEQAKIGDILTGLHNELIRAGVQSLIGSFGLLMPVIANAMIKNVFTSVINGEAPARALAKFLAEHSASKDFQNPVFWGRILSFGNGNSHYDINWNG